MNAEQAGAAVPEPRADDEASERYPSDLHNDPRIPSRAELDHLYEHGPAGGWTEQTARAFEYLDGRREIADERAAAVARGDTDTVERLDLRHALMDHSYLGLARGAHPVDGSRDDDVPVDAPVDAPVEAPFDGASVVVVPQAPRWERPSVPDDPEALRARIAALQAGRHASGEAALNPEGPRGPGGEPRGWLQGARPRPLPLPHGDNSAERRVQLAQWAEDDRRHNVIGSEEISDDGMSGEDRT